jgi:hypothetical protein
VPAPRHEEDGPEAEEQEAPPPPGRSRVPLIAGAAVAAVVLAVVLVFALRKPDPPAPPPLAVTGVSPASVPADGGTPVVVSGTGFATGFQVSLGGAEAAVTQASATALRVTAPPHPPGPADVVVTGPGGLRATLPGGITFSAPAPPPPIPPPRLQAASPGAGPAAGGTAVTLSGSGFAAGARVTFGGVPAPVSSAGATSLSVTAPAHDPGAVEVVVANPDGQRAALPDAFRYEPAPRPPRKPAPAPKAKAGAVVAVKDALNAIPTPAAVTGDGVISVQVEPYGDVFLDDRPYGEAPREFRVSAGSYVLKAKNPALGQREQRVTVKAGERVRWIADLTKKR